MQARIAGSHFNITPPLCERRNAITTHGVCCIHATNHPCCSKLRSFVFFCFHRSQKALYPRTPSALLHIPNAGVSVTAATPSLLRHFPFLFAVLWTSLSGRTLPEGRSGNDPSPRCPRCGAASWSASPPWTTPRQLLGWGASRQVLLSRMVRDPT